MHLSVSALSRETFEDVQRRMASRGPASSGRHLVRTRHGYALRSLLVHSTCGRRMQGNWNHDQAYSRCRFPYEDALANKIDHPPNVYLREDLLDPLDA